MYYPYLRGKQFELIALREFSIQSPNNEKIVPIVEPVKWPFNGLTKAIEVLFENHLNFALILNPADGDFKRISKNLLSEIPILLENKKKWIPAFIYRDNNYDIISSFIEQHSLDNLMIIFKQEVEINDNMQKFLSNSKIRYIVNGSPNSRLFMRRLSKLKKAIIRLDNCFIERSRNADYADLLEEKFTEEHGFYISDGFGGISDYTVLPQEFIDGGMLPYAVAIHLTYKKNEEEIYVHHFVSDTNDDASNVQRKFFEATTKVKRFFMDKEKTYSIKELIQLLDDYRYPGLGVIKKLSIKNHIELMDSILL